MNPVGGGRGGGIAQVFEGLEAPEYSIKTVSNFFENSRRYSQINNTGGKWKNLQSENFL
jgi:hypothetical protein